MPLQIVRNDITHMHVDAIVNAANEQLRRGGGVCGAIFAAAGVADLEAACASIGHCDTGSSVATPAFALPSRHIIHTVGPVWRGGTHGEEEQLRMCYRTALELAQDLGDSSIAFPLISSGIYGYPKDAAIDVALDEIRTFLLDERHEMDVFLTLFDIEAMRAAKGRFGNITALINDLYALRSPYLRRNRWERPYGSDYGSSYGSNRPFGSNRPDEFAAEGPAQAAPMMDAPRPAAPGPRAPATSATGPAEQAAPGPTEQAAPTARPKRSDATARTSAVPRARARSGKASMPRSLESLLRNVDASFSQTLLTMIDERSLKDSDVYKRANMSRQHFSKIRNNPRYQPKKATVLALAVALKLSTAETRQLLERAGFALTNSDERDVIVRYYIEQGTYDIYEINLALYAYEQPLLG